MSINQNNEWRIEQIALTILYRYFKNITISQTQVGICDYIVTDNDGTGLRFGVIVKNDSHLITEEYRHLIHELEQTDFAVEENKMPIIALSVDELAENAKVAFLVGWRFGEPHIYRDFELRNLNEKSADICLQIIKSMDRVIRLLSSDDLNVLKRITFGKKISDGRIQHAETLYLRKLTLNYRMEQNKVIDERQRLERMIKGIPEVEYPKDDLDRMIFESIDNKFIGAKVKSSLLLFSTELEDLQRYKNLHCHHTTLLISPDTNNLSMIEMSMLNGLDLFSVNLDVYVENMIYCNAFDSVFFKKEEPLEGWLTKLKKWKMMKETMKPISEFFR